MCNWRYLYYSGCEHQEFFRTSYCDEAKALGEPQRDAQRGLNTHLHQMSTLTPTDAGGSRDVAEASRPVRLPHADLIPRSAQQESTLDTPGHRNVNIDIPLDTQSTLSVELTHDAHRARASSTATIRPFNNDAQPDRASIEVVAEDVEALTLSAEEGSPTPRKSVPPHWKTTPRAPVLRTMARGEERERRKSAQGNSPVENRTIRGARSSVDLRNVRYSDQESSIKITVSPTRTSRLKEPVRVPPSVSTEDSVFHSARHSPVSQSDRSFVTANEQHDGVSHYALSEADGEQKTTDGTISRVIPARSAARTAAPKLSLRIPPANSSSTDRKPRFVLGSISGSGSGNPASPSRSRIPRAQGGDKGLKATSTKHTDDKGKTPQADSYGTVEPHEVPLPETPVATAPTRQVRTLNSTGTTPIQESLEKTEPDKHAMVTSYLEGVEPDMHQEVLAEAPVDAKPTASSLGNPTSRVTSVSTVKAGSSDDHVLRDPAIVSVSTSPARGRSTKYVPERTQERSDHSLGSSTSSDLRATAPEFVPQVLAPAPAQPTNSAMPVDPFSPEQYGMPAWMYQMYAVNIQQAMAPKKRGRKRGNSSPKKAVPPSSGAENAEREPFIAQLEEVARAAAVRHGKEPQDTSGSPFQTTPTRNRQPRNAGNGLYDTIGRGRGRQAGVPIDATMPFPTPVPPTGRQDNPGYSTIKREPTCGIYNIEQAAEWGGGFCNNCRPDH